MVDIKKVFAERLKLVRLEKGLTQEQLGQAAGIGKSAIANMEKAERLPSVEVLASLADRLGCSVDYLLCRTDNPKVNKHRKAATPLP